MGTHISNVASIEKSADGLLSQVRLSSAYCQYFWLLCDVVLKILDRKVITAACTDHGISLKYFLQCVEETNRVIQNILLMKYLYEMMNDSPIAICFSSWDKVDNPEGMSVEEWVKNNHPCIFNFVKEHFSNFCFYGVSAQGADYDDLNEENEDELAW